MHLTFSTPTRYLVMNGWVEDQKARLAISSGLILLAHASDDDILLTSCPCALSLAFGLVSAISEAINLEMEFAFKGCFDFELMKSGPVSGPLET